MDKDRNGLTPNLSSMENVEKNMEQVKSTSQETVDVKPKPWYKRIFTIWFLKRIFLILTTLVIPTIAAGQAIAEGLTLLFNSWQELIDVFKGL